MMGKSIMRNSLYMTLNSVALGIAVYRACASLYSQQEMKKVKNNKEKCPYGAYTCQGPQGSIKVCVTLVCLNMALNLELFVCVCVYAFMRHMKDICGWN